MNAARVAALLALALVACSGTATERRQDRLDELTGRLNSLVAAKAPPETVATELGLPERKEIIGGAEIWFYVFNRRDVAVRRTRRKLFHSSTEVETVSTGDQVRLEFRDGVLVGWHADMS